MGNAFSTPIAVAHKMPTVWSDTKATLCMIGILLVVALVVYLLYVTCPRLPMLSHTEDLEGYVAGLYADVIKALKALSTADSDWIGQDPIGMGTQLDAVKLSVATLLKRSDLVGDLGLYFTFHRALTSYDIISRSDLRNNAPAFVLPDGETLETAEFRAGVKDPFDLLRKSLASISDGLAGSGDLRQRVAGWDAGKAAAATTVHSLRMMLDQQPQITRMMETRRSHLPFAIWTVYYWPLVENVYKVRIPSCWLKFPARYVAYMQAGMDGWTSIGTCFSNRTKNSSSNNSSNSKSG
jgi:hypothetical protein